MLIPQYALAMEIASALEITLFWEILGNKFGNVAFWNSENKLNVLLPA